MITFESKGSFKNTDAFLERMKKGEIFKNLERYGQEGVNALANATPTESGETAESWSYTVSHKRGKWILSFHNSHMAGNTPVAIILQYGHGTGTGGYVEARDYINPVIIHLFDRMTEDIWKKVII